jgi:hypothetical protein
MVASAAEKNEKRSAAPVAADERRAKKSLSSHFSFSSAITFHNGTKINNHVPL